MHTPYCILDNTYPTLHTAQYIPNIAHCTLHAACCTLAFLLLVYCTASGSATAGTVHAAKTTDRNLICFYIQILLHFNSPCQDKLSCKAITLSLCLKLSAAGHVVPEVHWTQTTRDILASWWSLRVKVPISIGFYQSIATNALYTGFDDWGV